MTALYVMHAKKPLLATFAAALLGLVVLGAPAEAQQYNYNQGYQNYQQQQMQNVYQQQQNYTQMQQQQSMQNYQNQMTPGIQLRNLNSLPQREEPIRFTNELGGNRNRTAANRLRNANARAQAEAANGSLVPAATPLERMRQAEDPNAGVQAAFEQAKAEKEAAASARRTNMATLGGLALMGGAAVAFLLRSRSGGGNAPSRGPRKGGTGPLKGGTGPLKGGPQAKGKKKK